jgi:hypothetical protein
MHLTIGQLENNWAALGHAEHLNLRPNASLDIHFDRGGLDEPIRNAGTSLKAFLKSSRQWIERRGGQTAVIWNLENRLGVGNDAIHAHVLLHVPPHLLTRWHQLRRTWARKAGLNVSKAGVINFDHLPSLKHAAGKLKYMCKDLHPDALPIFKAGGRVHLDDRNKPSNAPVYGLKTGVSRNINAKARASHRHRLVES